MSKIQIYGKQEFDGDMDEDKDLSIAFLLARIKKVEKDKANDSFTYKIENLGDIIIKQEDKVITIKKKEDFAEKLRGRMFYLHNELGITQDFETWREQFKSKLIIYLDEVYEKLKEKS